ncbi:hypothetical protein Tco_1304657 [Tanacetum coccineum]
MIGILYPVLHLHSPFIALYFSFSEDIGNFALVGEIVAVGTDCMLSVEQAGCENVGNGCYGVRLNVMRWMQIELEKFYTSAGNPIKEILLKLNRPDHRSILTIRRKLKDGSEVKEFQRSFRHSDTERLSRSDEVLKLKNFKKDATLKLFKSTNQERYEHVGPEVTSSQDGKVSRWRRDCAWLMISRCSRSQCQIQVQGTSSIQKSMITTTYSQEKVKSTS